MNVFVELKLKPEKLDIHRINNLLTENINFRGNDELLDYTSLRFQILQDLKDANICSFETTNAVLLCVKSIRL